MEQSKPTFLSREAHEDKHFYQKWIRDVLLGNDFSDKYVTQLRSLRDFELVDEDADISKQTKELRGLIMAKYATEAYEIADELNENIFEPKPFFVGIEVSNGTFVVEKVYITEELKIVPVIEGEPYEGHIIEVVFDS